MSLTTPTKPRPVPPIRIREEGRPSTEALAEAYRILLRRRRERLGQGK